MQSISILALLVANALSLVQCCDFARRRELSSYVVDEGAPVRVASGCGPGTSVSWHHQYFEINSPQGPPLLVDPQGTHRYVDATTGDLVITAAAKAQNGTYYFISQVSGEQSSEIFLNVHWSTGSTLVTLFRPSSLSEVRPGVKVTLTCQFDSNPRPQQRGQ
jgi:hypothetical protein